MPVSVPFRKQSALSLRPSSPSLPAPPPINTNLAVPNSPRRAPLPPSPTQSTVSVISNVSGGPSAGAPGYGYGYDSNSRRSSLDWGPPPPGKNNPYGYSSKTLPAPPPLGIVPPSPSRRDGGRAGMGAGAGMYDTKLVSSTLSQAPSIPLSPTHTGGSGLGFHPHSSHSAPSTMSGKPSFSSLTSTPRPSLSGLSPNASSSVVVLPDGTQLPSLPPDTSISQERSLHETMAHSSPNSPWSLLTVHVLPLFAGGPLKSAVEDLNALCHSHIVATSQRTPNSRLVAVLGSDLRDFVASGMLTLKAKIDSVDEAKIISRAAEVWGFFWAQVLPYLEAVFLPFHQIRDVRDAPASSTQAPISTSTMAISVRHILLSGFLVHILLPLLPRLIPIIALSQSAATSLVPQTPSTPDLQRVLQMSLVLSTQAKYSSCVPQSSSTEGERRDMELRENVDGLGKAVRWRMALISSASRAATPPAPTTSSTVDLNADRPGLQRAPSLLQRGPSMSQPAGARIRRRGWRASSSSFQPPGQGEPPQPSRQNSDIYGGAADSRWGRVRLEEEDEDDITPSHSLAGTARAPAADAGYGGSIMSHGASASTAGASTLTAGSNYTIRDGLGGTYSENQRTPQADFGRRNVRADSSSSIDLTPMPPDPRRAARV